MADENKVGDGKMVEVHEVRMYAGPGADCDDCTGIRQAFNEFLDKWQVPKKGAPVNPCLMDLLMSYVAAVADMLNFPPERLCSKLINEYVDFRVQRTGEDRDNVMRELQAQSVVSLVEKLGMIARGPAVPMAPESGKVH
jgi:hypothetical protein